MNYSKIQYYFYHSRINRYYEASNKSKNHAVNLYFLNLNISKSFNPVLSIFEVILRNKFGGSDKVRRIRKGEAGFDAAVDLINRVKAGIKYD